MRTKGDLGTVPTSVPDPDPPDPHVFGSPPRRSMTEIAGSGSESNTQRNGSADPDPDPH
jgi:hypothetical protein